MDTRIFAWLNEPSVYLTVSAGRLDAEKLLILTRVLNIATLRTMVPLIARGAMQILGGYLSLENISILVIKVPFSRLV